ncbi:MAG: hypothetical protein AB2A00_19705 [Myxococcota bacterium]
MPRDTTEAVWTLALYAAQVFLVVRGMFVVTAPGVPDNSFKKIGTLYLATVPVLGWLLARRWQGRVRKEAMRIQVVCVGMYAVDTVVWLLAG